MLAGAVGTRFPHFITPTNLKSVLDDTSILILLALAQTPVLLTRSIDLSVAANLALTGMCVALFNQAFPDAGMPAVRADGVGLEVREDAVEVSHQSKHPQRFLRKLDVMLAWLQRRVGVSTYGQVLAREHQFPALAEIYRRLQFHFQLVRAGAGGRTSSMALTGQLPAQQRLTT